MTTGLIAFEDRTAMRFACSGLTSLAGLAALTGLVSSDSVSSDGVSSDGVVYPVM